MTFTKLFSSITESTVWCEPDRVRLVWITMLAMADSRGRVWASVPGLANRARVPIDDAKAALDRFLSPDEYSRTPENDGRRIEAIDGGWRLLNHEKYRAIRDEEAIKESKRKYINTRRAVERKSNDVENVDRSRHNAEAEADALNIEATPLVPVAAQQARIPRCPTDEIIKAFHNHLPMLPAVVVVNASRKAAISARWREVVTTDKMDLKAGIEWFDWFFAHAAKSRFLTGKSTSRDGRAWHADLDWLMKPANFAKTIEGNYHKEAA